MFERPVYIDGTLYRQHETTMVIHTLDPERTSVRVHSSAGNMSVNTQHDIELDIGITFEQAEDAMKGLDFFKEAKDPYAEVVEELGEKIEQQSQMIDSVASMLTDEQAIEIPEVFHEWAVNVIYAVGYRVNYDGMLYKCLQAHTSQADWTPDVAASLWANVAPPDVIPVWVQPDSTNPYMKGDKVHYPDAGSPVYESLIDNNTWSPEAYSQGWQEVEV